MKPVHFGFVGVVLQGIFLAAYIFASRMSIAAVGKPVVIGLAMICMALLLWQGVKQGKIWSELCLLPVLLAVGYTLAFHLIGMLGFHALLRDWEISADYFLSVLRVTFIVFVLYSIGTAALYILDRLVRKRLH